MSTERGPDAGFDRLVREAIMPGAAETAGACPDADTLAAYVEGGLTGPERGALEPHLASCARCLGALALLARDADAEASMPAAVPAWRAWLSVPRLRWLAPAAAAALGVILYVAVKPAFDNVAGPGEAAPAPDSPIASRAVPERADQQFAAEPPAPPASPTAAAAPAGQPDMVLSRRDEAPSRAKAEQGEAGLDKETKKADATMALAEAFRDAPVQKAVPADTAVALPSAPAPAPLSAVAGGVAAPPARLGAVAGAQASNEAVRQEPAPAETGALMVAAKGRRPGVSDEASDSIDQRWHAANVVVLARALPGDHASRDRLTSTFEAIEIFKRSPAGVPMMRLNLPQAAVPAGRDYVLFIQQTPGAAGDVAMTLVGRPVAVDPVPSPGTVGTSQPSGAELLARLRQLAGTAAR